MWWQAQLKSLTCLLFFLFIAVLTSFPAMPSAQQIVYQRVHNEALDQIEFNYQWLDQRDTLRSLSFTIHEPAAINVFDSVRQLSPQRMNRLLIPPLTQFARSQGWHQLEIALDTQQLTVSYKPHIRDRKESQKRVAQMRAQEGQKRQVMLNEHFLTMLNIPPNLEGIAPDHPRIALASTASVAPVSRAFYESLSGSTPRQYVDVIASFIQAIPYSALTNRLESGGKGFSSPVQLLLENRGDCDSKVTLMAAILRNLMPNINMAIVYLPNHALLAIAVNALEDDIVIDHDGVKLVVVEPTGPTKLSVGNLTPRSALYVNNGNITVKPI